MKYLTVGDVAERLGLSKDAVYQLCSKEHAAMRHLRMGGARATIRIPEDAVDEFITRVTVEPTTIAGREPESPDPPLRYVRPSRLA